MRELRKAISEGPRAALVSASHLPRRHPATFAMALGGVAIALLALGYADTRRDVNVIEPKVTQIIESAAACQKGASRLELRSCVRRIEIALERCRQSAACRAEFRSLLQAVKNPSALGGGDAQNPSTASQPSAPAPAGARGGTNAPKGGSGGGQHKPSGRGPKAPPSHGGAQDTPDPAGPPPVDSGSAASTNTPGKGNGPPGGMPEQAGGPFGSLTDSVGGAVNEVGKGLDKAACPAVDRLTGLCSVPSP